MRALDVNVAVAKEICIDSSPSSPDLIPGLTVVIGELCHWVAVKRTNMLSPRQAIGLVDSAISGHFGGDAGAALPGLRAARTAIEELCQYQINDTCYLKSGELIDLMHEMSGVLERGRRYA